MEKANNDMCISESCLMKSSQFLMRKNDNTARFKIIQPDSKYGKASHDMCISESCLMKSSQNLIRKNDNTARFKIIQPDSKYGKGRHDMCSRVYANHKFYWSVHSLYASSFLLIAGLCLFLPIAILCLLFHVSITKCSFFVHMSFLCLEMHGSELPPSAPAFNLAV